MFKGRTVPNHADRPHPLVCDAFYQSRANIDLSPNLEVNE